MAAGKKNACRQHAWLVFEDETAITDRPPIRSTWAPKGQTPVVTHPYRWTKMSVAGALGYRWDGRRCRLYFQIKSGNYNSLRLIRFLKLLKRHFRGKKVILIWDRLNGHRSHIMKTYLAQERSWLKVEFLPPYAPDLNPVETLWGNVKGQEVANLEVDNVLDMADDFRKGMARVRRNNLAVAFLAHAGLSLD